MTESEQAFLFFWNKFCSRLHDKVRKVGPEPPPVENHCPKRSLNKGEHLTSTLTFLICRLTRENSCCRV